MTTTQPTETSASQAPPRRVAKETGPSVIKPRRDVRLIAIGVVLAVICALVAAWLVNRSGSSTSVVVVSKDLQPGERIEAEDLTTTNIVGKPSVQVIRATEMGGIVGIPVSGDTPAGTLLNRGMLLEDGVKPRVGELIVAVPVTPGQYPASGLRPGDQVRLIVTGGGSQIKGINPGTAWKAQVLLVGEPDANGARTVDLSIADQDADRAAAASGSGSLTIAVVTPVGSSL